MRESKGENENRVLTSPSLQQSLQTIHEFLDAFPGEYLEEHSWELISSAFTSEAADNWTPRDRSNMLQLYKHLSKLGHALAVVDKQLWPLYPDEEKFN
jgi:hypothetical protein